MNAPASTSPGQTRIGVRRLVHAIHPVGDIPAWRAKYLDLLGGLIFAEGYFEAEDRDMALLYVSDTMIEPMAPRDRARLDKPFARYLQRFGEGFHSFELMVEDGPAAATRLKDAGYRLGAEYGGFFYVRQESVGVLLEVCATPMPNDPFDRPDYRPEFAGRHPSTLLDLDHIACVIPDADAALALFAGPFDGELLLDERILAPQPGRRLLVRLAGHKVAFLQPDDPAAGPLGAFLARPTSGVYAMVWRVEEPAAAETYLRTKGVRTT